MATGYTHEVQSGEVTSFKDFLLNCSRAFGACIHQKEDGSGPPTLREVDTYYLEEIEDLEIQIKNLKKKSDKRILKEYRDDLKSRISDAHESIVEKLKTEFRYKTMLDKVLAWTPPTDEHHNLKNFMIQQLNDSIDFDCNNRYAEESLTMALDAITEEPNVKQIRDEQLKELYRNLSYWKERFEEEKKKVEEANNWITALYKSL